MFSEWTWTCFGWRDNDEEEEEDDDDDGGGGGGSVLCDSGWGNTVTGMALVMIVEYDM